MKLIDKLFIFIVIWFLTGCVFKPKLLSTGELDLLSTEKPDHIDKSVYGSVLQAHYLSLIGLVPDAMAVFDQLLVEFPDNSDLYFQYAKFYLDLALRAQDKDTAVKMLALSKNAFLKTIQLDPSHFEAQKMMASIYIETEEFKEATTILEELVDMNPEDTAVKIDLARLYIHEQETEKSIDLLKPLVEDETIPNPDILKVFALANAESNRLLEAIAVYNQYLKLSPDDFEAMFNLALCYFRSDQYEEAEKTLAYLHRTMGLTIEIVNLYVDVLKARGKFEEAVELLKIVAENPRFEINALLGIGEIYLTLEKFESAEKYFLQAVTKAPNNRQATFYAALVYQIQDKCRESLGMIANNLEEKPISILSAELAIHCLLQLNDTDSVLRLCSRLLDERPEDLRSYLVSVDVLEQMKQHKQVIEVLRKGVEKFPEDALLNLYYASRLEQQGDWKEALAVAEKILERSPDDPDAANFIGYVLADRNLELDRALALIETALADFPEDAAYLDSLGWVLFRMGRLDDALKALEKAMEKVADDPTIVEHLIHVHWAIGNHEKALELWEEAMRQFPDHEGLAETGSLFKSINEEK